MGPAHSQLPRVSPFPLEPQFPYLYNGVNVPTLQGCSQHMLISRKIGALHFREELIPQGEAVPSPFPAQFQH